MATTQPFCLNPLCPETVDFPGTFCDHHKPAITAEPERLYCQNAPLDPTKTQPITGTLRDFATSLLDLIDKAEQPFTAKLMDPKLRNEVLSHLSKIPGYREDILEAIFPWLTWDDVKEHAPVNDAAAKFFIGNCTWEDVSERLSDDAAEDDEVIETVLENADFRDIVKRFEDDIADHIADLPTEELVEGHGATTLARDGDVRNAVLRSLEVEEAIEALGADVLGEDEDIRDFIFEGDLRPTEIRRASEIAEVRDMVLDTLSPDDFDKLARSAELRSRILPEAKARATAASDAITIAQSVLADAQREIAGLK